MEDDQNAKQQRETPPNCAICFDKDPVTSTTEAANRFNKAFTRPVSYTTSKDKRKTIRKVRQVLPDDFTDFSEKEVTSAIRATKKSTALYALAGSLFPIPLILKSSIIIPLLKPGKQATDSSRYRPISLLSPVAKVIERLLLNTLQSHIPPAEHQHGFTTGRSITLALLKLTKNIADGFNEKKPAKRTVLMAIDMSKAFDSIDITKLIDLLMTTSVPNYIKKWIPSYLRGRTGRTLFRNTFSSSRLIRNGVELPAQGSALSPTLFNLYLRDLPSDSAHTNVITHADDITVCASNSNINTASEYVRMAIPEIESFLNNRSLTISPAKSQLMLLTPFSKEYNTVLDESIGGTTVSTVKLAKILGVTFDTMFTFSHHARNIAARMTQRTNGLKALADSTWGNQKESLRTTLKAISEEISSYAAPAWYTFLSALASKGFNAPRMPVSA